MTARILGIDPGLSGGFAVLTETGVFVTGGNFPTHITRKNGKPSTQLDGRALADVLKTTNATHAFVEVVSSRPRQAGQFQFGLNCGLIHGILHAHKIPFALVAPATWKSSFSIKREHEESKSKVKSETRALAAKLFPAHAHLFSRVKDDGVAEAALIALHGLASLAFE